MDQNDSIMLGSSSSRLTERRQVANLGPPYDRAGTGGVKVTPTEAVLHELAGAAPWSGLDA
jgi:hypothetical protein